MKGAYIHDYEQEFDKFHLRMDGRYDSLQAIRTPENIAVCQGKWFNQTLHQVNGSVLRLGMFEGESHMHKPDHDDEVLFVLDGGLTIEAGKGRFELGKYEGICIPHGVMHRPIAR